MNDEQDAEIDATKSKCWTCKFGMCIKESEVERIYHPNMRGFPGVQPPGDESGFGIFEDISYQEKDDADPDMIEHTIEHKRVKTICYWRPDGIENAPPILVSVVDQCSRFQEKMG